MAIDSFSSKEVATFRLSSDVSGFFTYHWRGYREELHLGQGVVGIQRGLGCESDEKHGLRLA